mgnify:FL=1
MDEEKASAEEHRARLSRVTLEIEKILLRENLAMGDFLYIVDVFNARANKVFSETKIKKIKEDYGKI